MGKLMILTAAFMLLCFCGCTDSDIDMNDPETRSKLVGLIGDTQAANMEVERAQRNGRIYVAAHDSTDSGYMISSFNGVTKTTEYQTTYDDPWATTTTTTKITRR